MESRALTEFNYERLADEIVIQAVKDYRSALKKLYKHPENPAALERKSEVEEFFYSSWFQFLTNIDPDALIEGIKAKTKREIIKANMKVIAVKKEESA